MFKIQGLDEFQKNLKELSKRAENLHGEHKVSFDELFTKDFVMKYSNFSSFDELLEAGNFIVNSEEDFEAIPDDEFDNHINSVTNFPNWESMLAKASEIWTTKQLFD